MSHVRQTPAVTKPVAATHLATASHRSAGNIWGTSVAATGVYVMGMVGVTVLPMNIFLYLTETPSLGGIDRGILQFSELGTAALLLLVAGLFAGSVIVGGVGKSLLRSRFVHGPVLLVVGLILLWVLVSTLDEVRQLEGNLSNLQGGDNGRAAAFVAYWAVMVSYCGKAVWDEIRDRVSDRIDHRLS